MQEPSEVTGDGNDHALTVFYDGSCPICSREINMYRTLRGAERIEFTDASALSFKDEDAGITRESALAALHARDAQGTVFVGVDAFTQIWAHIPAMRLLAKLENFAAIRRLLQLGYLLFVRIRGKTVMSTALFRRLPHSLKQQLKDLLVLLVEEDVRLRGETLLKRKNSQSFGSKRRVVKNAKLRKAIEHAISRNNLTLSYRLRILCAIANGMATTFISDFRRETTRPSVTSQVHNLKRSLVIFGRDYPDNQHVLNYLKRIDQALH